MSGSSYGKIFRITTFGESHGAALGVVIDGCPAGLELCEEDIAKELDRRKPGQSAYTTQRKEADTPHILSGVFEGKTTGTPIAIVIYNEDHHSADYDNVKNNYRPGHADFTFDAKYGFRDYRGGGRSSGRETVARVAAGAIAGKILESVGINVKAYTKSIGSVSISKVDFNEMNNPVNMPDAEAAKVAQEYLDKLRSECDSAGGVVECIATDMIPGLGETVFDKLDALLAHAIMSVGAVKGVEIGDGFAVSETIGSQNNDAFVAENGNINKSTNHSGGVLGGMSDGSDLIIRAAIKPTPSIAKEQNTVNRDGENTVLVVKGRHDPVIVPRATVVVESMVKLVLCDMLLQNMSAKMENVLKIYK